MINKQSLWFLTLFSLILVLSVYYITMPNELLLTNNSNTNTSKTSTTSKEKDDVVIKESDVFMAMRVEKDDQRTTKIDELNAILTNTASTVDEKNNAFEQLKAIGNLKGKEEALEAKIKKDLNKNAFIKIDNDQIRVIIEGKDHNYKLANEIMRSIQAEFDTKMYISVKFQA